MEQLGRVTFIGAGNMASAIIAGLLAAGTTRPHQLIAYDVRPEPLEALATRHQIATTEVMEEALEQASMVLLCVKPQTVPSLLPQLAKALPPSALVLSVAAGIPCRVLEARLPAGTRVVRAMPNTPALVGVGATGIAPGEHANQDDLALSKRLFDSVGVTVTVEESQLDAVTGLSGSGPAYVFRFAESLVSAAEAVGLSPTAALQLTTQTLLGAATLLSQSQESAAQLRERVTSKGGTTAAGLAALEEAGFSDAILSCVRAATERATELGQAAMRKDESTQ